MKASHGEGSATHTGPESCAAVRGALTGVRAGRVFSRESLWLPAVDGTVSRIGKSTDARR
jgi:hypothetical protein